MATTKPDMDELARQLEAAQAAYKAGLEATRAEEAKKAEAEVNSTWATVANAYAPVAAAAEAGDVQGVAEHMAAFSKSVATFATLVRPFARRASRGNGGGNGTGTRPGALRDLVEETLRANPGTEYTGSSMGQALGRSSGAAANALEKLAEMGVAVLASEKPRRYRLA